MRLPRRSRTVLGAALGTAAIAISASAYAEASAVPAAIPGWRIAFQNACGPKIGCGYVDVTSSGTASAWAVGGAGAGGPSSGRPIAAQWRSGSWHASTLPPHVPGLLFAVSTDSAHDAWAVTVTTGYALHWNGTRWSVARRWPEKGPLAGELTGVTAFGPRDVWVFGGPGANPGLGTWHFNGHSWTRVAAVPGNGIVFASALSPANMWAVGSIASPQDSIVHYTGRWHQVKAPALGGLQFNAILALSTTNVWAAATVQTNNFKPFMVHLTTHGWVRIKIPWAVSPGFSLASDGHGGLWLPANTIGGTSYLLHRSAAGAWTRIRVSPSAEILRLARIPGSSSLWGAGALPTKTSARAAIFLHGPTP